MSTRLLISLALRPLILIAFAALVAWLSSLIRRALPNGKLKAILTKPMHLVPQNEAERQDWTPVIVLLVLAVLLWGGVAWLTAAV